MRWRAHGPYRKRDVCQFTTEFVWVQLRVVKCALCAHGALQGRDALVYDCVCMGSGCGLQGGTDVIHSQNCT